MVAIIDYGLGNLYSVKKSLDRLGMASVITRDTKKIKMSDYIILPGVGSFKQGMCNLKKYDLVDTLNNQVLIEKKKFLGICLGFQLIFEIGTENGLEYGLGWIKGEVNKIESDYTVPHTGWNNIRKSGEKNYIDSLENNFYFVHSYHVKPYDLSIIDSYVYHGIELVSSIKKNNIFGVQFHPEKSQQAGLNLLKEFFE